MIEVTLFQKGGSLTGFLFSGKMRLKDQNEKVFAAADCFHDADDRDAQLLMRALELGIRQLAQSYPENIRIHCETPA